MPFECSSCKQQVDDGYVMVDSDDYDFNNHIGFLKVVCKPCTKRLDDSGEGGKYEHLWDLRWVVENPFDVMEWVFSDLMNQQQPTWSTQALSDLYRLLAAAPIEMGKAPADLV